jgi:Asp-tRNA(Asn)/Glu-tRNA(Gln) amidotransferase C subunit
MTEVEFSRLLAELTSTAKVLNDKSDSINGVIKMFEQKLREISLGLEVWLTEPLTSEARLREDQNGEDEEFGTEDEELGLTKIGTEWCLAVRTAYYKYEDDSYGHRETILSNADTPVRLLDCSRALRIEAIKKFPALVQAMNAEAQAAVKAIEAAKKLVQ